jgi:anti-sigma regulatory factor (Ser/Thr protein kinase)
VAQIVSINRQFEITRIEKSKSVIANQIANCKLRNREMASLTVPNRVESVRPATAFLVQTARDLKIPAAAEPVFEVAVSEALTNAVRHGGSKPDATITCDIELKGRRLTLRIIDGGSGFEMPTRRLPDISPHSLESVPEAGYGLPIIQYVFPIVRVINVGGRFGVELGLNC